MVSLAGDAHVVGLASLPGDDGLAGRGAKIGLVAFAGEVGAARIKRAGHGVVDILTSVGVELGAEWRRIAHLHMGRCSESQAANGEDSLRNLHVFLVVVIKFLFECVVLRVFDRKEMEKVEEFAFGRIKRNRWKVSLKIEVYSLSDTSSRCSHCCLVTWPFVYSLKF